MALAVGMLAPLLFVVTLAGQIPLLVTPGFASVHTGASFKFTASYAGASNAALVWQVNGVAGGNAVVGLVSAEGEYRAPASVPAGTVVTLRVIAPGADAMEVPVAVTSGLSLYVSTKGKDTNSGTLALPWRTIQHAADTAIAGDTVYVRGGTYHESVNFKHSGSATAGSIVFQSYPKELAVVDGTGVPCCGDSIQGLFNLQGSFSYVVLEGFTIQNYSSRNITNEPAAIYVTGSGSYLRILNNIVHGITETAGSQGNAHGIGFYGTSTVPLSNLYVSGNVIYGLKTGNSEVVVFDGNINGFSVTGNVIHDNDNIAIDATGFYQVGPSGRDQVHNGLIALNTVYNITSLKNPAYNGYGADGIYCDGCAHVVIERNLVFNCDLNIEAASETRGHDASYVTIRNNVVYGGNLAGISIGGYSSDRGGSDHVTIVNNTLWNNNRANQGGDFQIQFHATSNVFENNIVFAGTQGVMVNGLTNSTAAPVVADYNTYFTTATPQWWYEGVMHTTFASYQTASGQDKHSHFVNPGMVSVKVPYSFDLLASSLARGAGSVSLGAAVYGTLDFAGNARTSGSAINAGAYQK